jgi:hypothetical protein
MGRGFAWFDMGTHDSLIEASAFVQTLEKRQGLRIACPEEIAYVEGFITHDEFVRLGKKFERSAYGQYLLRVASESEYQQTKVVLIVLGREMLIDNGPQCRGFRVTGAVINNHN